MRDMALMQKQADARRLEDERRHAGRVGVDAARRRQHGRRRRLVEQELTLPVLGFAAASVYAAETVDKGLTRVRAGTGATGKKLASLEGSFRKVAAGSEKDLETVGTAIADVNTRLGLTGKPLEPSRRSSSR